MTIGHTKTERLRDPIHDIIVFELDDPIDKVAWRLLETPDFQRLRRIKQLGVSEFVYPSASHTRFAHSVGVFHNARRLVKLIKREIDSERVEGSFDEERAKICVLGALLHDIGHGPFSHAFEEARKSIAKKRGGASDTIRAHEKFTADMIRDNEGEIHSILTAENIDVDQVAHLFENDTPEDMYHAIVSSSFDADRLDYLVRDRYMTGTGSGAIDLEWLMDNARVAAIDFSPAEADNTDSEIIGHSFCLYHKARDAAEDFLLSRYRLYTNVYFHKTTRGIEQMISAFFRLVSDEINDGNCISGLANTNPVIKFFSLGGETLSNYRALDDTVVWGAIHDIAMFGTGPLRDVARRILHREKPKCIDIQNTFPDDFEKQRRIKSALLRKFSDKMGTVVLNDVAKLSLYGEIGADDQKAHKRLMIMMPDGNLREITAFHDSTLTGSEKVRYFERFYFLDNSDFLEAKRAISAM